MWNSGCLDFSELPNILPKDVKAEYFAKGTEKCKILGNLMVEEVENLDDHGFPKTRDLADLEADGEMWICSSYPFRHKNTLQCAERKAKYPGQWTMQLKLEMLYCELYCQYLCKQMFQSDSILFYRASVLSK